MSKLFSNISTYSPNRIGSVTWQYALLPNHISLKGGGISSFSTKYPELLDFFQENNLLASTQEEYNSNKTLAYYDESTDTMIMPDFTDNTHWGIPQIRYQLDDGFPPIGTIINFMGTKPPIGYLKCDGEEYEISKYRRLADVLLDNFGRINFFGGDGETTFAVPDLRGEFLRGTGTATRDTGSGADVGIHQNATEIPTITTGHDTNSNYLIQAGAFYNKNNTNEFVGINQSDLLINKCTIVSNVYRGNFASTGSWNSDVYQKFTTRPTNTSVLYCIKY